MDTNPYAHGMTIGLCDNPEKLPTLIPLVEDEDFAPQNYLGQFRYPTGFATFDGFVALPFSHQNEANESDAYGVVTMRVSLEGMLVAGCMSLEAAIKMCAILQDLIIRLEAAVLDHHANGACEDDADLVKE